MNRTELIQFILENDGEFSMQELVCYSYSELVMIKVKIELEKDGRKNGSPGKN